MISTTHLLTLRVTLRDEAACAAIPPEQANAYLAAKGWQKERSRPYCQTWSLGDAYATVVLVESFADYGRRMLELVNRLADIENRSALAVYCDLMGIDTQGTVLING